MPSRKPILVTGAHRSGTTWVGRMIATSPSVVYIHEPFSLHRDTRGWNTQFDYWFTYVCEQNNNDYYQYIKDTIEFRYSLMEKLKRDQRPEYIVSQLKKRVLFNWYRLSGSRPLLKDPIALFSADWLFSKFNFNVVVMIRHPAAFVASIKEKDWTHPFSHFTNQPALMREHLQPFEKKIIEFTKDKKDIVDQASLLWNLTHYMILKYKKAHPDWIYARHEDLSQNPVNGFRCLFEKLGLKFSEQMEEVVKKYSMGLGAMPTMDSRDEFPGLNRDSLENIYTWKKRLTISEIERIKSQVGELSKEFYSEDEW